MLKRASSAYTWKNGHTPAKVWNLAIKKVRAGEHLVDAVLKAVYKLWSGSDELYNRKQAPEVDALNTVRALEDALVGVDFFADYTTEQAVDVLKRARDTCQKGIRVTWARRSYFRP